MTSTTKTPGLFLPTSLGPLPLANRLVMAPLSRNRAGADGVPGELMTTYYVQRASAGLIIAEGTTPNPVGQTFPNIPAIHTPAHVAGWRQVTDAVRAAGGAMFLQLQHGGRVSHPRTSGLTPVAPSAIPLPDTIHTPDGRVPAVVPREMTLQDIRSTVADFARAARNAVAAGFAGVEVHAANGMLLHQFMAANTNRRTDAYGGTVAGRVRFAVEVTRAVAEAIGPERVGLRISPANTVNGIQEGDETPHLYAALLAALADSELAYLHLEFADPADPLFARLRADWPGTLMANPALGWPAPLPADGGLAAGERLLAAGADLVALGRGFLANPDLVERLRTGAPLNPVREAYTMYVGGATGYTDYPTLAEASADGSAVAPVDAPAVTSAVTSAVPSATTRRAAEAIAGPVSR
ncbi:alkene reductase [Streptomyces sp. WAC06614]|uniref:alkene reductase n=1 Tax=Streptomyces sp. WAC06614 TaxID=2487416 RepID=UPI000F77EA7D|nr:alkene reductase [Streptomyces sp. WAC06614]RSS84067.1 alkene reductase [Streptomyces sp. WAC06614]